MLAAFASVVAPMMVACHGCNELNTCLGAAGRPPCTVRPFAVYVT
jgi:hypothetical protein